MKKAILLLLSWGSMYYSLAQENPSGVSNQPVTKEDYLKKSKGQRTGAIVLISTGGAITIAGITVAIGDAGEKIGNNFVNGITTIFDPNAPAISSKDHKTLSTILIITGLGSMLGSIALFSSAHKYKMKALSLSLKNQKAPQFNGITMYYKTIPSLTLKISL